MELKNYIKKGYNKKFIIRLKDMKNFFSDKKLVKEKLKQNKNPLIYTVLRKKEEGTDYSLTVIEQGKIGREHFMTRGHYHTKAYPEIYILLKGKGILLVQNRECISIKLKKNKIYYLAPRFAHRTINLGKTKLEILTIESAKAGHRYGKIKKRGFRKHF